MRGKLKHKRKLRLKTAVLGEGITEQFYLKHLKEKLGYNYSIKPSLFNDIGIEDAEGIIDDLISVGCDNIVFLTDYDTIVSQNKKNAFDKLVKKYAGNKSILICESMPSIEYWFLLHFIYTTKEFTKCEEVEAELKNHIKDYKKSIKYLKTDKWFSILMENEGLEKAKGNAEKGIKAFNQGNIGQYFPFSKVHLAIEEFEKQKNR